MMLGHFEVLGPSRSTRQFSMKVNGCGQTLHIPVRHGVCVRSRNQLAGTLQQIRRHITTTPRSGSEKSSPAGSEKRRLRSATFWSNQSSKQFVRGASQSTPDYYTLRVRILLRSE